MKGKKLTPRSKVTKENINFADFRAGDIRSIAVPALM
jgi:hypothetical protein